MKTIKQIADEVGVNVQTVYRRLNKIEKNTDESLTTKIDGITYFTDIGEKLITDSLTPVKQQLNHDKQPESEIITFLTTQIENLQKELRTEREHSRQQAERLSELSEKLTELTRNSQILLKQEQDKTAFLLPDGEANANNADKAKVSLWNRIFKRKEGQD